MHIQSLLDQSNHGWWCIYEWGWWAIRCKLSLRPFFLISPCHLIQIPDNTKHIASIQLGQVDIDCWFHSPYIDAEEGSHDKDRPIDKLFICEYCLLYFLNHRKYRQHQVDDRSFTRSMSWSQFDREHLEWMQSTSSPRSKNLWTSRWSMRLRSGWKYISSEWHTDREVVSYLRRFSCIVNVYVYWRNYFLNVKPFISMLVRFSSMFWWSLIRKTKMLNIWSDISRKYVLENPFCFTEQSLCLGKIQWRMLQPGLFDGNSFVWTVHRFFLPGHFILGLAAPSATRFWSISHRIE